MSQPESQSTMGDLVTGLYRTTRALPRDAAVERLSTGAARTPELEARALRLARTRLLPTLILGVPVDEAR